MSTRACRIGADVGGTFTDVLAQSDDGHASICKVLSTPPGYDDAVIEAVEHLTGADPTVVREVIHGTTVATNAVLQRRGSPTALITTAGFRDVLEIRRLRTPHMYDPHWKKPPQLVERDLRFEIAERVSARGEILEAPDEREVERLADRLAELGTESVAICFLHSYLVPDHERMVGEILRQRLPAVALSLSSEILREQGEYERTATTVVNAYVMPLMAGYLARLRGRLGHSTPLMIMKSSGGIMTDTDAARRPVYALESGPAAGVIAALGVSELLNVPNVIAFDMGGTTAKASLIEDGRVTRGREYEVGGDISTGSRLIRGSGELLRIPTIDIAEVGAGGGSIGWLDPAGGLHVGPQSAGADPGPASYGNGGLDATVTDANVVLGYMRTGPIGDGAITISGELARASVERVARGLRLSLEETAQGLHQLANARMMRALRAVSSERGRDPRSCSLIAYGGAGPIHAAGLAADLGVETVIVPPMAGIFSAAGLLFARPEFHDVRPCYLDVRSCAPTAITELLDDMRRTLAGGVSAWESVEWTPTADLRYSGQSWELEVELGEDAVTRQSLLALSARFEEEHERLYGVRGEAGARIEIRAVRLSARGGASRPMSISTGGTTSLSASSGPGRHADAFRVVQFPGGKTKTPVRTRDSVQRRREPGPCLIDEYDATIVVPPDWSVRREDRTNSLVLESA